MKYIFAMLRFSFYGFFTFATLGYFLQNPYITESPASLRLIVYLGIAGAISFLLSATAAIILSKIYKELLCNG